MTQLVFPLAPPTIAVRGSEARFPVRRLWCVGRNYLDHIREMGNDDRDPPIFFSKQPDMVVPGGGTIRYPVQTKDYHHEVELVVALKGGGDNISAAAADAIIFGHAVGLDMTRRDLQKIATKNGRPWEAAKSFEQSAPVGSLTPASAGLKSGRIQVSVNGAIRQDSDVDKMIWCVSEIIAQLSTQVTLAAGDIIFTGTPAGVGAVVPGDKLLAQIDGLEPLNVTIA